MMAITFIIHAYSHSSVMVFPSVPGIPLMFCLDLYIYIYIYVYIYIYMCVCVCVCECVYVCVYIYLSLSECIKEEQALAA